MDIRAEMLRLETSILRAVSVAQMELSRVALEDCNKFCKLDTGELRASSYRASNLQSGRLIWSTKYARNAYYTGQADTSKNPLASRLWAHKAAALYRNKWYNIVKSAMRRMTA